MSAEHKSLRLSVVVPVLNEAAWIEATLAAIMYRATPIQVIVVDGGSTDCTVELAARGGAQVAIAPRGRGGQMHVGAQLAKGDVIWFLHADTLPPEDSETYIANALKEPWVIGGNFEIRFLGEFASARFLTWLYRHLAWIGLRYGDSGYFVRRRDYEAVGGFRAYPVFEDLDLLRRLRRRGRFVRVSATVATSARRFEGRWFGLVFARWTIMQVLYWAGVSPIWLGRFYEHVRVPRRARQRARTPLKEAQNVPAAP